MGILDFVKRQLPTLAQRNTTNAALAKTDDKNPKITTVDELPAHVRSKAVERKQFIELVKKTARNENITIKDACQAVANRHQGDFPLLSAGGKYGASQLTYDNYRNWRGRCRGIKCQEMALVSLADRYVRGDQPPRGDQRFWEELHAAWLNGRGIPVTQAYRHACRKIRQMDPEAIVPTINQATYQLRKVAPGVQLIAAKGSRGYLNTASDYIDRDWSEVPAGRCVIGDSRTFDTRVRVYDYEKERWTAVRPTIVGLLDARSLYIVAYWITTESVCADTIIDTMRLYVAKAGNQPPAIAYFDNGADYCAQGFAKDLVVQGKPHSVFRELGIQLLNALPSNAKAKTIERVFKEVMQNFDKNFPDYLGSKPEQRTIDADWFDRHPEELPSEEQFNKLFDQFLDEYHHTPQKGKILAGQTPHDVWHNRDARPSFTPDRLFMSFLRPIGTRVVCRGPAVQIKGDRYICDDLEWGTKVLVKTDSMNPAHVYCFTLDGALIGEALLRDPIPALCLDDPAQRDAISDRQARARRQVKKAKTVLHDLTGGRHVLSILELMAPDNAHLLTQATKRDPIKKVAGPEATFNRQSIPQTFPDANDLQPPPPRPAIADTPKVDRQLLAKVHRLRHRHTTDESETQKPKNPQGATIAIADLREHLVAVEENGTPSHLETDYRQLAAGAANAGL